MWYMITNQHLNLIHICVCDLAFDGTMPVFFCPRPPLSAGRAELLSRASRDLPTCRNGPTNPSASDAAGGTGDGPTTARDSKKKDIDQMSRHGALAGGLVRLPMCFPPASRCLAKPSQNNTCLLFFSKASHTRKASGLHAAAFARYARNVQTTEHEQYKLARLCTFIYISHR
jgi:hypothetical protein